jgi:CRISPR-associated endonuclease/helicase Cas3
VELVIGRMRPIDRDDQLQRLQVVKAGTPRPAVGEPLFVVTTQCVEVGADLDFDVLVTECAGIDALLQRFGRLDRLGGFGRALGSIMIASGQTAPKRPDVVYGDALPATWRWLKSIAGQDGLINMGIEAAVAKDPR